MNASLINFLFPKHCVHCGRFGHYLCQECYDHIDFIDIQLCPICHKPTFDGQTHPGCKTPWGIDGILCAVAYNGPVKSLIKKIKYPKHAREAHEEIDLLVSRYFTDQDLFFSKSCILTPVPLHKEKREHRGFNQSLLIAQSLKKIWHMELNTSIITRSKKTKDQVHLTRKQRAQNMKGVFSLHAKAKHIVTDGLFIVVDDVSTTGATLKECAKVLKRNGAQSVWGVAVARD